MLNIPKLFEKLLEPIYKDAAHPLASEIGDAPGAIGSFLFIPAQYLRYASDKVNEAKILSY